MKLPLKEKLTRRLITERYGSVDALVIEWDHRLQSGYFGPAKSRDRATIYRWLNNGLPSKAEDIYGFAATLDVDVMAVIDINPTFLAREYSKERLLLHFNSIGASRFSPLWMTFRPGISWPSQELATSYYKRDWSIFEFEHDGEAVLNVYAGIEIRDTSELPSPWVYHFAYRRKNANDKMWRPFGTVVRNGDEVILLSESGDYQRIESAAPEPTFVETFFGPGPAEFRIASLHRFSAELTIPSSRQGLRFIG